MNRVSKIVFIAAASLAVMGGPAVADNADPPADGDATAGGGATAGAGGASVSAEAGVSVSGAWTQDILNRPLTLKKGMIAPFVGAGLTNPGSLIGVTPAVDYGVSDKLQVGGSYAFSVKDFEIKGDLGVRAALSLTSTDKLKAAATVASGYDIQAKALDSIDVGVGVLYKLAPKFGVFTPGGQFSLGVDPATTAAITLPVGVMLQATPMINVQVQTTVATIGLKPTGNVIFGKDAVPVLATASYSPSNKMDIGVAYLADVKADAGAFLLGVFVRLYNGGGI